MPVTVGAVPGALVEPAGMVKLAGDTVAIEGLLLASVMATPPAGAAAPNATGRLTLLPAVTVTPEGSRIPPAAACVTVTLAVAVAMPAPLAVMVTDPAATPVTGTESVVPLPKVIAEGTVATAELLELRPTTRPAGAPAESVRVMFWVTAPLMLRLAGEKLIVVVEPPVTSTCEVTEG